MNLTSSCAGVVHKLRDFLMWLRRAWRLNFLEATTRLAVLSSDLRYQNQQKRLRSLCTKWLRFPRNYFGTPLIITPVWGVVVPDNDICIEKTLITKGGFAHEDVITSHIPKQYARIGRYLDANFRFAWLEAQTNYSCPGKTTHISAG